jgi:DNA-directed RNA polymerase subunit alpha
MSQFNYMLCDICGQKIEPNKAYCQVVYVGRTYPGYRQNSVSVWFDGKTFKKPDGSYAASSNGEISFDVCEACLSKIGVSGLRGNGALNEDLFKRVEDIELSLRALNVFSANHIELVGDLVQLTDESILSFKNSGKKILNDVKTLLVAMNLNTSMSVERWSEISAPFRRGI